MGFAAGWSGVCGYAVVPRLCCVVGRCVLLDSWWFAAINWRVCVIFNVCQGIYIIYLMFDKGLYLFI